MRTFTTIAIIYNPVSTGPSDKIAHELAANLKQTLLKKVVKLVATKYAGHAEELAYKLALESKRPLIISSSGDGGYHEVVNGVMRARSEGASATTGLLPAGNANDHYKNLHATKTIERILKHDISQVDLLHISAMRHGKPWVRYAHSYIGIGLTPTVGKALNKVELNRLNEPWVVMKAFFKLHPSKILVGGRVRKYDNLIFSNVAKMSKIVTMSEKADMFDGIFEVTAQRNRSKFELVKHLSKAVTGGLEDAKRTDKFEFKTINPLSIQLDGEIFKIDGDSQVTITCQQRALSCLI